ncbi:unnamed protein product [Nesidiocoris tenuis]|uniref:Uncharacterized protein n=1 Tax=Nesidiocoris tenuis TaxID=355587 RepID=A0A6H5H2R8_9HEMI|nr:unnamed protein product [Nesidiocoris tenuis]
MMRHDDRCGSRACRPSDERLENFSARREAKKLLSKENDELEDQDEEEPRP